MDSPSATQPNPPGSGGGGEEARGGVHEPRLSSDLVGGVELGTLLEAVGLPGDAAVTSAGGATGRLWRVSDDNAAYALRLVPQAEAARRQMEAMRLARAGGVPVPQLLHQATTPAGTALLIEWSSGIPVAEAALRAPHRAAAYGGLLAELQDGINQVHAPEWFPPARFWWPGPARQTTPTSPAGPAGPADTAGTADTAYAALDGSTLLHLDFHPLNVLVEDTDRVRATAVLDWDNTMRGHRLLEDARVCALIDLDPAVEDAPEAQRAALRAVYGGWRAARARAPAPVHRLWAAQTMLSDLASRYAEAPYRLAPIRAAVAEAEHALFEQQGSRRDTT